MSDRLWVGRGTRRPAEEGLMEMTQAALWNGAAARGWVAAQESLDRLFAPFTELLAEAVGAGARVLDVGCGTGGTTVAIARAAAARCIGVDISEAMIAAARARAEREGAPVEFVCADAETHEFEPGSFDVIASRFGVMFFGDPARAFRNLRRATREGGELRAIAWRSAAENPFMTTAERAAAPLLPNLPARRENEPGQFAFAERRRVRAILDESGWAEIEIRPIDVACTMPQRELAEYVTRLGPVGRILQEADEGTRARVAEAILPAFDGYVDGEAVRFSAACWAIGARNRGAATS